MGTPFLLYRQSDAFDQGAQFTDDDFPTVILFDISRSFFAYFASQPLIRKEFVKLAAEVPASFVVKCRAALQAMVLQHFAGSVYQYGNAVLHGFEQQQGETFETRWIDHQSCVPDNRAFFFFGNESRQNDIRIVGIFDFRRQTPDQNQFRLLLVCPVVSLKIGQQCVYLADCDPSEIKRIFIRKIEFRFDMLPRCGGREFYAGAYDAARRQSRPENAQA